MASPSRAREPLQFEGFDSPNGTIVPNVVFDLLMPQISEAELKVLLYIVRHTFGYRKNADAISLHQLINGITTRDGRVVDRGTGMSRSSVIRRANGLVEKGIITVEKRETEDGEAQANIYALRFRYEPGISPRDSQQTDLQQTEIQQLVGQPTSQVPAYLAP